MIKENQRLLNQLHVLSDIIIVFLSMLIAYWIRYYVFDGSKNVGLSLTVYFSIGAGLLSVLIFATLGIYESFRITRIYKEIGLIFSGMLLVTLILLAVLFVLHMDNTSRWQLAVFFGISTLLLSTKRLVLRSVLYKLRKTGFNQKHVLIVGSDQIAQHYLDEIELHKTLGFTALGYVADFNILKGTDYLGKFDLLEAILEEYLPDEVIVAISGEDYKKMPDIISACEKSGTKITLIPYYALYMPSNPQIDNLNGIPMVNLRRIPLDNFGNAFLKRTVDLLGSLFLIVLFSPLMLIATIGVKLSSPGPIIFKQERIGLNKKSFNMYKFRSMKVNSEQKTGWSTAVDDRRTKFGFFIRKFSIDELPQFFNVLTGSMSLVGPRPEVPHFVEQFKEEIPRYMVKHQVRPGITGWAQVNGLRGDTSIRDRIDCDIFYIENWSLFFDIKILFMTLFRIVNKEKIKGKKKQYINK